MNAKKLQASLASKAERIRYLEKSQKPAEEAPPANPEPKKA